VIKRFIQREDGNVAIIGVLLLLPILMLAGAGVDYSRISSAEDEMKTVVDNTVYNPSMSFHNRPAAEAYIADMINANSGRNTAKVKISINQNKIRISIMPWRLVKSAGGELLSCFSPSLLATGLS